MQLDLLASGLCFLLVLCIYIRRRWGRATYGLPLPPGPKQLPLIGNILDLPGGLEWKTFHKWSKEFDSDIIYVNLAGTSVIVLDTYEAAMELLEKRSSIYSSRPRMPMINELMGWDFNVGFMPYGDRWRRHRKLLHQEFHESAALRFQPQELKATHGLLRRLLDDPDNIMDHIKQMAGETIISVAYGLAVQPKDDPYIETSVKAVRPLHIAVVPGAFLVDAIPILKYVPGWLPFAGFQRKAREWRKLARAQLEIPFEAAKRQMESGGLTPSYFSRSLEKMDERQDLAPQEQAIKATAGVMFTAGSDTTVETIAAGILGLLLHPRVLKKAQSEIDTVVGNRRLPDFDDYDALPYMAAVAKETMRWRTIAPVSIPHLLISEDIYKGYRIPAGSVVVQNTWAMMNEETIYPNPAEFNPDRFIKDGQLDPAVRDPRLMAFGLGRRICPGRHMAFSAVWLALTSILATTDIMNAVDENGEVIELHPETLFSQLKCFAKPRSKAAEELIRATAYSD